jgi:hypothetical protein
MHMIKKSLYQHWSGAGCNCLIPSLYLGSVRRPPNPTSLHLVYTRFFQCIMNFCSVKQQDKEFQSSLQINRILQIMHGSNLPPSPPQKFAKVPNTCNIFSLV